jgi:hypothetical protein
VTLRRSGEAAPTFFGIELNPATCREDAVLIGPAEIAFTRIPRSPRSNARYRTVDSSAAFAIPAMF